MHTSSTNLIGWYIGSKNAIALNLMFVVLCARAEKKTLGEGATPKLVP
jgi:hypothetical protein